MDALCHYVLVPFRPRLVFRSPEVATEPVDVPLVLPVLMKALAPFREAREAVVRALREAAGFSVVAPELQRE